MSTIHMRIVQGNELIADLPEWPAPVPRVGEYLFHPPYGPERHNDGGIAGCVKVVTWRTHDRPTDPEATSFVMTAHPYVEITI